MNNIIQMMKSFDIKGKGKVLALGGIAFVLLAVCVLLPSEEKTNQTEGAQTVSSDKLTQSLEKRLQRILVDLDGVGEVKVMITLESCYENVYAVGENQSANHDGAKTDWTSEETYITVKKGSSTEECLVVKVYEPVVRGVAVVAQGAQNISVKKAITDTVCAVFSVSSTRVSVEPMAKE